MVSTVVSTVVSTAASTVVFDADETLVDPARMARDGVPDGEIRSLAALPAVLSHL